MKKELYIIDEKLKNDQMSLKKIVHCDIVSTVEQRSWDRRANTSNHTITFSRALFFENYFRI